MRTYYIFKINDELKTMYNKKSNNIYKLLNSIRLSNIKDKDRVNKLYKRITKTINKKLINDYIIRNHLNDFYYKKIGIYHELSNEIENSILIVNNTYIKIVTNNNISTFFKDLYSINDNYFLIDFDNKDYFYLEDLKTKITCL